MPSAFLSGYVTDHIHIRKGGFSLMKKLLSLFLALALLLSVVPVLGEALPADEADAPASGIPAVGDVVEGFEVKEIREFGLIGADLVLFEHQKTGGKHKRDRDDRYRHRGILPVKPVHPYRHMVTPFQGK